MEATTNSEQPCLSVLEPFTHSLEPYNSSNSSKPCLSILKVCMPSPLSIIPVTLWCMFLYTYFYFRDLFTTLLLCSHIIWYSTLREKYSYLKFFWSECRKIPTRKLRNGHFSRSTTHHLERTNTKVNFSPTLQSFTQSIQQGLLTSKSRYHLSIGLI